MRTTLDIDEKLLESVIKLTGEKSKSKAVGKALEAYKRQKSIDALLAMAGKLEIDDMTEDQNAADLRRQEFLDRLWRGEHDNR